MLNFFQQPAPRSGKTHRMRQHEKRRRRCGACNDQSGNRGVHRGAEMDRGGHPGAHRPDRPAGARWAGEPAHPPHPAVLSRPVPGLSVLLRPPAVSPGVGGLPGRPGGQCPPALLPRRAEFLRHLQRKRLLEPVYPVPGAGSRRPDAAAPLGGTPGTCGPAALRSSPPFSRPTAAGRKPC